MSVEALLTMAALALSVIPPLTARRAPRKRSHQELIRALRQTPAQGPRRTNQASSSIFDPIEQLCLSVSLLHTAIEEVARESGVDVDDLLEAADCITAQVLVSRHGGNPLIVLRGRPSDKRKPERPDYLKVVKLDKKRNLDL